MRWTEKERPENAGHAFNCLTNGFTTKCVKVIKNIYELSKVLV